MGITGMTTVTFRDKKIEEIFGIVKQAGIKGVEVGGDVHLAAGDIARAEYIKKLAEEQGITLLSYGSYFRVGDSEESLIKVIDTAKALGVKDVRIWLKKYCEGCGDMQSCIEELKRIAPIAERAGVTLGIEYHDGTFNSDGKTSAQLIDAVGSRAVRTYWQPVGDCASECESIRLLGDRITNVHVYYWTFGGEPERHLLEENEAEWKKYIELLGDRNYILEFTKDDLAENFIRDARTLNGLLGR